MMMMMMMSGWGDGQNNNEVINFIALLWPLSNGYVSVVDIIMFVLR